MKYLEKEQEISRNLDLLRKTAYANLGKTEEKFVRLNESDQDNADFGFS
jgi:hypothetical protein